MKFEKKVTYAFKEGKITSVSHFKNPSSPYDLQRVLLMISKVYSNGHSLTTLWDPGSDITMITFAAAQRLGLRGKDILLNVTGIGNKTRTVNSKEYNIPLTDCKGNSWTIVAYGINEISESIGRVDLSRVVNLFENVCLSDLDRPDGEIELLVGSDWCNFQPQVQQTVDKLQLMQNVFGYCLRGSHPLVKFISNSSTAPSNVKSSYHVSGKLKINDISLEKKSGNKPGLAEFFEIESLGTYCIPRCGSCKCGSCPEGSNNYSIKREES